MEDKKNAVIVVDFGQNTFGGYFIKYSDGSVILVSDTIKSCNFININ